MESNAKHIIDWLEAQSADDSLIDLIDNEQLNNIDQKVSEYIRHFRSAPNFPIKCDEMVIGNHAAWHKWFRARVLSYNENLSLVKVFAIDYGHELELPKKYVFPLLDMQLLHAKPVRTNEWSSEHSPHVVRTEDGVNGNECEKQVGLLNEHETLPKTKKSQLNFLWTASKSESLESDILQNATENAHSNSKKEDFFPEHSAAVNQQTPATARQIGGENAQVNPIDYATSKRIGVKNRKVLLNRGTACEKSSSEQVSECTKVKSPVLIVAGMGSGEAMEGYVPKYPDDKLSNDVSICNTETGSQEAAVGYVSDESRRKILDFDNYSEYVTSMCIKDASWYGEMAEEEKRLPQLDQDALVNDIKPLKELSLIAMKRMCIGNNTTRYNLSECYENFLPHIAEQLKELPKVNLLQELVWPHLLEGRSAIIIDPSENLADLVYLPAVCSQVNVNKFSNRIN